MNILGSHDFGKCYDWVPPDSSEELTITPYKSLMYAIGNGEEDFGEIIISDLCGELLISSINIEPIYRNKGYEKKLIHYVLTKHKTITYIYPSSLDETYQLASLGFEPFYIEDWSNNSHKAPWDKGYREMIYIPNPTNGERANTFYKVFLMVLSNIKDVPIYEPLTFIESNEDISIHWKYKDKEIKVNTYGNTFSIHYGFNYNKVSVLNNYSFRDIEILSKWLISNEETLPNI